MQVRMPSVTNGSGFPRGARGAWPGSPRGDQHDGRKGEPDADDPEWRQVLPQDDAREEERDERVDSHQRSREPDGKVAARDDEEGVAAHVARRR